MLAPCGTAFAGMGAAIVPGAISTQTIPKEHESGCRVKPQQVEGG